MDEERNGEAVVVHFRLSDGEFGSPEDRHGAYLVEDALEAEFAQRERGEYDGHEFGGGWCRFFIYGADAEALSVAVLAVIGKLAMPPASFLIKRTGGPGAPETRVNL